MIKIDLAICKHFNRLPTDDAFKSLSFHQKILLYDTIVEEESNNVSFIKECFEALKPWLDKDMFFSIKDGIDNTRVNAQNIIDEDDDIFTKEVKYIDEGDDIIVESN